MPRPYHSASSTELGKRCQRAWAYCYLDGLRDPEVPWREEMAGKLPRGVTPRQRSAALGGAAHKVLEDWYAGKPAAWLTFPGLVVEAGRHLLPQPDACEVRVETPIGTEAIAGAKPDGPAVGFRAFDVLWAGYRDLVAVGGAELSRLRIPLHDGIALFDHKTTASIGRYAKSPADLIADLQCNLYALATMQEAGRDRMAARWVYYETKEVRRALPVDVMIFRHHAEAYVSEAAELARTLDQIERSVDAPQNVNACADYGGCPYHVTAGGPCDARRAVGKLIKLGKGKSMALTEEQKAKFAAFRKPAAAPAETSEPDESGETEAEAAPAAPAVPKGGQLTLPAVNDGPVNGAAAKAPRGRPRKAAAVPPPPAGGLSDIIVRAGNEIAEAEQAINAATMRRDEAIAALRAALA